jgi:fructoselysine-6-P-deglycase FrlB-like protein
LNPDDKGIIGRIIKIEATQAKMDERLSKLENFNKRVIWIGIGLSLSAGYSFDKILELFKK